MLSLSVYAAEFSALAVADLQMKTLSAISTQVANMTVGLTGGQIRVSSVGAATDAAMNTESTTAMVAKSFMLIICKSRSSERNNRSGCFKASPVALSEGGVVLKMEKEKPPLPCFYSRARYP